MFHVTIDNFHPKTQKSLKNLQFGGFLTVNLTQLKKIAFTLKTKF